MIDRRALPGIVAGAGGIGFAIVGLIIGNVWVVAVAGVCALAAGALTATMAGRLRRSSRQIERADAEVRRVEHESDEMAARAARFEAEAITARAELAQSMREAARLRGENGDASGGIVDAATGLFNGQFFTVTLDKRVSASRRGLRPLAVVLIEVVNGLDQGDPADPKAVAAGLIETLRDADTACRLDDGRYAVILEDTPENGAVWTVERIRRCLADQQPGRTVWAGIACYPAHAFDAGHILEQAEVALVSAKDWRQDRIEVAALPDD